MSSDSVRDHFDEVAPDYDHWKHKASYYYTTVKAYVAEVVPPGRRVLEVGCGTGDILASLDPEVGFGIDLSPEMVARAAAKHPQLRFAVHDLMGEPLGEQFDFVVAVDVAEHVSDLGRAMASMAAALGPDGRLVLTTVNPAWGLSLELAERLHLKMPEGSHTWRSRPELESAARGVGLTAVSYERTFLVPKAVPLLRALNTAAFARPLRRRFGMIQRLVFARAEEV
jgi:SAM-dependent methyltransferase